MWKFLLVLILFVALPAAAQRDDAQNRLLLELLDKVERLQNELNELRNRNDHLERKLEKFSEEFAKARATPASPPQTGAAPQDTKKPPAQRPAEAPPVRRKARSSPEPSAPPPVVHGAGERRAYRNAVAAMDTKDYLRLRSSLGDFLERYPRGQYAASAKYWIGESWYAERKFDQAETWFERVIEEHVNHQKSEDASLKIALIGIERGRRDAARDMLRRLAESAVQKRIRTLAKKKLQLLEKRR